MNIKEIVDKHSDVAFYFSSVLALKKFLKSNHNIIFSKGNHVQTLKYLTTDYLYNLDGGPCYGLICKENKEYQFYCRNHSEFKKYIDWDDFKIINYNQTLRKEKLDKINEKSNI